MQYYKIIIVRKTHATRESDFMITYENDIYNS